jgi:hypothetical protein
MAKTTQRAVTKAEARPVEFEARIRLDGLGGPDLIMQVTALSPGLAMVSIGDVRFLIGANDADRISAVLDLATEGDPSPSM